ncbi:MAG: hypothetical protein NTW91_03070 [Verrucomicrobia bacterium]|nr:hypothetical protein [Verrucomicrobiota bacterium]
MSIGLGVGVFLSITIANRSAVESFHRAFAMVTGRADLEIRGRLPEMLLPAVQACAGVAAATPLVEGTWGCRPAPRSGSATAADDTISG